MGRWEVSQLVGLLLLSLGTESGEFALAKLQCVRFVFVLEPQLLVEAKLYR